MKNFINSLVAGAILFTACNSSNNKTTENKSRIIDTGQARTQTDHATVTNDPVSVKEIVTAYLQIKNAFAKDNSADAATAGASLQSAFKNFDTTALSTNQKNIFNDVADDATEHAEHISKNGGKIEHQREHFKMLSEDIYDLVKAFGSDQTLYKDFCPMYNDGKGGYWISETKEIKNPYLGKQMPTCGTVKEEIK